jgi:eukaryotic-like serine/threonine-protein kinase
MPLPPDEDRENARLESLDGSDDDSLDPLLVAAARALEPTAPSSSSPEGPGVARESRPSGPPLASGALIAGRYRLDEPLGEGGMGEVWAATHAITRRRVAMKFLKGSAAMRMDLRQRMLREARAASVVKHPSVVEVLDVFELEGGVPVLVMDLLVGETLGARLAKNPVLGVREAAVLLLPVVEAVEAAHAKGIVHRDLKPDNIFLKKEETGDITVKVLDFGIAKLTAKEGDAADTGALTETGSVVGTPWYMAPEQCYGERDIDPRADVWALGVILYECLAGVRPVEGASMGQILKRMLHDGIVPIEERVKGVPPELGGLIRRMLSHAREGRPGDLSEVHGVLSTLAGRTPRPVPGEVRAASPIDGTAPARPDHGDEARPPPPRVDTDGSHAVPGPRPTRPLGAPRRSVIAFAVVAVAAAGFGIVYVTGVDHRAATTERLAPPSAGAPAAAAPSANAASLVPTPAEVPSPARSAPAAGATESPLATPAQAPPTQLSGARLGPARPAERATGIPARPALDAGAVTPGAATPPASAQPPKPKTPEGRLFEDVPF